MKISVLGLGLGFSLSCLLSSYGHKVVGVDIKAEAYKNPRLDYCMKMYVAQNQSLISRNLRLTTNYGKIRDAELIVVFVSTPLEQGRLSTKNVESAIQSSLERNNNSHFALLSTLPIGGCDTLFQRFPEIKDKMVYVPPMVRQGMFLGTFTNPPSGWQMISDNADPSKILEVYKPILSPNVQYIFADYRIVEVAKLVTNVALTQKIVLANTIDDWCEQMGLDAKKVMKIVGMDPRIGNQYISPGGPASGACLPRDLIELLHASEGSPFSELLQTLKKLNDERSLKRHWIGRE